MQGVCVDMLAGMRSGPPPRGGAGGSGMRGGGGRGGGSSYGGRPGNMHGAPMA